MRKVRLQYPKAQLSSKKKAQRHNKKEQKLLELPTLLMIKSNKHQPKMH